MKQFANKLVAFTCDNSRRIYSIFHFLTWGRLFGRTSYRNFISPLASVRNRGRVFLGNRVHIYQYAAIWCTRFECGDHVSINLGVHIFGDVDIGNNVLIAPGVMIANGNHGMGLADGPMIEQQCWSKGQTRIGNDVWIGANAVILDGVVVEDGAVVAAGAVVTKRVAKNAVVAGNPAKCIYFRE